MGILMMWAGSTRWTPAHHSLYVRGLKESIRHSRMKQVDLFDYCDFIDANQAPLALPGVLSACHGR